MHENVQQSEKDSHCCNRGKQSSSEQLRMSW